MAQAWTVPKLWNGERVWIIAGGQSARWTMSEFADARGGALPDKVIAIKDGCYLEPNADLMIYTGKRYHKERPDLFERWEKYRIKPDALTVKRSVDDGVPAYVRQMRRATAVNGIIGLCEDPRRLGGWCCGGSALNLAFHLGAVEICLIGYDLRGNHWNPAHPYPRAIPRDHQRHAASIDAMAAPLRARGVRVLNLSPISSLKEFPVAKITSLL